MNQQKSFQNENNTLYVVATPIGNLQEMTPRAIEVLSLVDVIAAEDTRHTIKLLQYFQIKNKCIAHHKYNERDSIQGIIKLLEEGNDIALVSDAGYPLLSDPGQDLVSKVIEQGFNVVPVSGSSALLNALVASGLTVQPFLFYGFLDANENKRKKALIELKDLPYTLVFYEAPHRIVAMLENVQETLGNRSICLARELTKQYEEFYRGTIGEILPKIEGIKGEIVVVIQAQEKEKDVILMSVLFEKVTMYIHEGYKNKEAIKKVAEEYNVSKNYLYNEYHNQLSD